ncbi:hypothetical protein HQ489_01970 [Candidatus Woesearchaeota archaeon]|nr:hypothetical protein [Candidatus Woesearchaeota archaeon]
MDSSDDDVRQGADIASSMQLATHRETVSQSLAELSQSPAEIADSLAGILEEASYDPEHAQATGLIISGLRSDVQYEGLDYLGKAIVLVAESERGRTNQQELNKMIKGLLHQNGYKQHSMNEKDEKKDYLFVKREGTKVIALSDSDFQVYNLRSRYHLNEFVKDYHNLKEGTSNKFERDFFVLGTVISLAVGAATMVGIDALSDTTMWKDIYLNHGGLEFLTIAASPLISSVGTLFGTRELFEGICPHKGRYQLAYDSKNSGITALLEAFPLDTNRLKLSSEE